jgi:hypothetical protein
MEGTQMTESPPQAITDFINNLWPLAYHEESRPSNQGNPMHCYFTPEGERYPVDFTHCGPRSDWYQFDSHQDAWYFGQWVNPVTRQILSYVEGDISLITCQTPDLYRKELENMTDFEGRNGLDDHDGRHWEKLN